MLRSLIVVAFSLFAGGAVAQETSFLLVNRTGYPISQLSVSPTQLGFWGPNVLHPPAIQNGQARQVTFPASLTDCMQDIKIGFADDGAPALWQYLNLCVLQKVTLHYDRASGITTASYD